MEPLETVTIDSYMSLPPKVKVVARTLARSQPEPFNESEFLYDIGVAWLGKTIDPPTLDAQGYLLNSEQRAEDDGVVYTKAGTLSTEVKITFTFLGKRFVVTYHVGSDIEISNSIVTLYGEPTVAQG